MWDLYAYTLEQAGRVPNTMIEWDANIPPLEVLFSELQKAKAIAERTHSTSQTLHAAAINGVAVCPAPIALPVHALAHEQQRMQNTILQGDLGDKRDISWIRSKDNFASAEQLAVYTYAYRSRLIEVTAEDYPVLQHLLGDTAFDDLLKAFVGQTQSVNFNITRYTPGLPPYLASVMPQNVFAHELAQLEDAICQLQDALETEALTPQHLAGLTPDDLMCAKLKLRAAAKLFSFTYPIDDYYTAVLQGQSPAVPAPQDSYLLVYRHDDIVWRLSLEKAEFQLLQSLSQGVPVGEACAQLEGPMEDASDSAAANVSHWFSRWIRNSIISHPIECHEHPATV